MLRRNPADHISLGIHPRYAPGEHGHAARGRSLPSL